MVCNIPLRVVCNLSVAKLNNQWYVTCTKVNKSGMLLSVLKVNKSGMYLSVQGK